MGRRRERGERNGRKGKCDLRHSVGTRRVDVSVDATAWGAPLPLYCPVIRPADVLPPRAAMCTGDDPPRVAASMGAPAASSRRRHHLPAEAKTGGQVQGW